jgi:hypothetical protein
LERKYEPPPYFRTLDDFNWINNATNVSIIFTLLTDVNDIFK